MAGFEKVVKLFGLSRPAFQFIAQVGQYRQMPTKIASTSLLHFTRSYAKKPQKNGENNTNNTSLTKSVPKQQVKQMLTAKISNNAAEKANNSLASPAKMSDMKGKPSSRIVEQARIGAYNKVKAPKTARTASERALAKKRKHMVTELRLLKDVQQAFEAGLVYCHEQEAEQGDLNEKRRFCQELLKGIEVLSKRLMKMRKTELTKADAVAMQLFELLKRTKYDMYYILSTFDVQPMYPLDQPYNPSEHVIVAIAESNFSLPNTVVNVIKPGITLKGYCVRRAEVAVAR